jgi:phosphate transport system substrate-binding protein
MSNNQPYQHRFVSFILIMLSLLAFFLAGCGSSTADEASGELQGSIAVSGAWALYPMMTRWQEEFNALHPAVRFDTSAGGAGKGLADALGGAVDIGMVSRDITPEEEAKGAYWIPVTKDAVFATISAQNPLLKELLAQGLTREVFVAIFITGEVTTWGQALGNPELDQEIHVYTRSDACGAAETWAKYLGGNQEDLLGVAVFGDPGLLDAVIKDPMGIGFNNLNYAYDMSSGEPVVGAAILPIDQDEDGVAGDNEQYENKVEAVAAVATGDYPSPPARALNLVTNGKPDGLVKTFLQWVLSDGQAFVDEAGYVQLTQEQLQAALEKLK